LLYVRSKLHRLSNIDPINRRAVCAHCGPVHIKPKQPGWRCGVAERKWKRNRIEQLKAKERPYRKYVEDRCARCGFKPEHPCQLDVHHLDGNHGNSDRSNLATLCANCHRLTTHGVITWS
jgi:hypothetical protein